ncbi:gfo/Idh/MocA family oxidoreductase [Streptomyces dangxiongensis]|uniref:Gfo/Idh/MocA family oxidoreductase n=1 Tax=Streptomyces dangxiongensis TaxID=1442032 RepID=A0A3G2JI68_9ACTN|nr:Gfo/Idh/MocA family oxidoreductase [Streptomyces dangxiongensis]AYN40329.1 gfo/Idh/MocA family oxidoreductase [Streptomyces dangxiongensis]
MTLRYGVVGCGRVFQRFHLPEVTRHEDVELVAVCDADEAGARKVLGPAADGVLVTTDLTEFLGAGRPDVVAVCTPNDAHTGPVLAALAAGAHVLCEKPLAADLDEARRLAAADFAGRLSVNLPYRFHELVPVFRDALPGDLHEVTLTFTTAGQRLWRPVTNWYGDPRRAGGGALLDLGAHALDLLGAVFGGPAEAVGCRVDRQGAEERVVAEVKLPAGPATVRIDRASRTLGLGVEAVGADGESVVLDLKRGEVRGAAGVVTASERQPELAAIRGFLDAVTGRAGGRTVPAAEALAVQELIARLYAVSVCVEGLTV